MLHKPVAVVTACVVGTGCLGGGDGAIVLNPATEYQTITGWAGAAWIGQWDPRVDSYGGAALDSAVAIGMNRLRLEIRAGVEHTRDWFGAQRDGEIPYEAWECVRYATVDDNNDPRVIDWDGFHFTELDIAVDKVVLPFKARLDAIGRPFHLNVNYVAFTSDFCGDEQHEHADNPDEYAEFVLATYLYLQERYGLVPDTWEVLLEPENAPHWDATKMTAAIRAAGARLRDEGFTPAFVAPSGTAMRSGLDMFDVIAQDSTAVSYLHELAYHRYRGGLTPSRDLAAEFGRRGATYSLNTSMLEWIGASVQELHEDLTVANVSAWQQYALADIGDDFGGFYFVVDADVSPPAVRLAERTRYLQQYFRYVPPGSVRIEASSDNDSHDVAAFRTPDGAHVVVLTTAGAGTVSVSGLELADWEGSFTTDRIYHERLPDITVDSLGVAHIAVPGNAVTTLWTN